MLATSLLALALVADPQAKSAVEPRAPAAESSAQASSAGSTSTAEISATDKVREPEKRGPKELRDAVRAALRRTAKSWKATPEDAARLLLPLFVEIKLDTQLVKADRDSYSIVLRNRLKKIGELLAARKRLERPKEEVTSTPELGQVAQTGSVTNSSATTSSSGVGAAGGQTQPDYGKDLVELIERTISPDTWDVNGGPGSIVYYQPLHVIVVRQTGEIHEQLGGVLGQLKK